jgi:isopentenyl-diphosphate delta-isomerase
MIDDNELLFVVDEQNQPLDPLPRKVVHAQKLWHRTAAVWVLNRHQQLLCQQRSLKKDIKPGMWEAFLGGHLGPGDDYSQAAVAEIGEELGITVSDRDLAFYQVLSSDKSSHKEFQAIFGLVIGARPADKFVFELEEIAQLRWYELTEVKTILLDEERSDWVHKPWDADVLTWLAGLLS